MNAQGSENIVKTDHSHSDKEHSSQMSTGSIKKYKGSASEVIEAEPF